MASSRFEISIDVGVFPAEQFPGVPGPFEFHLYGARIVLLCQPVQEVRQRLCQLPRAGGNETNTSSGLHILQMNIGHVGQQSGKSRPRLGNATPRPAEVARIQSKAEVRGVNLFHNLFQQVCLLQEAPVVFQGQHHPVIGGDAGRLTETLDQGGDSLFPGETLGKLAPHRPYHRNPEFGGQPDITGKPFNLGR